MVYDFFLQPPCDSPPCESPQREGFEGASPVVFRGTFKRSLSQGDIQERVIVVLLSGNVLPLSKDCDTRDAKRRRLQAGASRRWEAMGYTQRRQLGSIQGEGVDSKRWERNV